MPLARSVLFCAAVLGAALHAQAPRDGRADSPGAPDSAPPPATGAADLGNFEREPAVVERLDTSYRYHADGTGTREETAVVRIQNEAGLRAYAALAIPYLASTQKVEIGYVRVRHKGGTTVVTPPADLRDQVPGLTQVNPFYSDVHLAVMPVRGLAVGDTLEYSSSVVTTVSPIPDQFWATETFGRGRVVLRRTVELHVPVGKLVTVSSPKAQPVVQTEGGERVYRWSGAALMPTVRPAEGGQPSPPSPGDPEPPPIAWTTWQSWAELGAWYRGALAPRMAPTPAIRDKAEQITYGLRSPGDRVAALYGFVSREIRSTDVPLSQGPLQAHTAAEVLENLYGNSLDKQILLVALLRAEHLPAALALVGPGNRTDAAIPSPAAFTDALTVSGEPGPSELWLDTLPEVALPGSLRPALRDQLALVMPAAGDATLQRTPATLPYPASDQFTATGTLSGEGSLTAHIQMALRGDNELRYRQTLRSLGPTQWDRVAQVYLQSVGLAGEVSGTVADNLDDATKPLQLSFDLSRTPYGDWDNYRVLPLEPGLELPLTDRETAPDSPVQLGNPRTERADSRITLPNGFGADLPPAVHLHTSFADLDKTYALESTGPAPTLVTHRVLVVRQSTVPLSAWPEYRSFVHGAAESEPWVQLTSQRGAGGHGPPAAGADVPAAAQLVEEAEQALTRRDWPAAEAKLDQAKALNPRQAQLWSSYGLLAQNTGRLAAAAEAFRREVQQHPEETAVSRQLAAVLLRQGQAAEAVEVLRTAVAGAPQDQRSAIMLAAALERTDRAGAEAVLRAALKATPDSLALKLQLGRVLLEGGRRDEAATLLTAVATGSNDPEALNDAAYALGDAGLNLRVAEAASRRSIQLLNLAVVAPSGGRSRLEEELRRTLRLISAWDTYGWVLVREGNTSEAEPWLRAAAADSGGGLPARHLAALAAGATHRAAGQATTAPPSGSTEANAGAVGAATQDFSRFPGTQHLVLRRPDNTPSGAAVFAIDYNTNSSPAAVLVRGDQAMADLAGAVAQADTHTVLLPGTQAHLYRLGSVRCGKTSCTLDVLTPRAAVDEEAQQ